MSRFGLALTSCLLLAAPLATGCGYSLATPGADLPRDVRTLYIAPVAGDDADPEVSDALARELRRLVRERAYFRVSDSEATADAVLRVHLVDFFARPVAFDKYDEVLDYETTMRVDATLERDDGEVLWRGKGIESTRSHAAVAGAVVSTSSAFQAGERIRLDDLAEMADAQLGESRRRHAHASIAEDLADAIYSRIMAGL
jgi:outer membrane lipopolysaccharide assembly protein LptE/RlpB